MGCAKSHAVIAAEYRAVGPNRLPRPQFTVCCVGSQVAIANPTWGIVSSLNRCCERGLKLEGSHLKQRPDLLVKDHWLI